MNTLAQVCQRIGAQIPYWTQGAGGNVSIKEDGTLWIKASGTRLSDVTDQHGVAKVDLAALREKIMVLDPRLPESEKAYSDLLVACSRKPWGRPSMESGFHALLPNRWVAHFHSLASLLMAHHNVTDIPVLPPVMPGLELSLALAKYANEPVVILSRHGVVLQAEDIGAALMQWTEIERNFCANHGYEALLECSAITRENASGRPEPLLPATPIRIYFPDTAVFLERLENILAPLGENNSGEVLYDLIPNAIEQDRDATELWRATQHLYRVCPDLEELPLEISSKIGKLPTEVFRKSLRKEHQ